MHLVELYTPVPASLQGTVCMDLCMAVKAHRLEAGRCHGVPPLNMQVWESPLGLLA
jgi:hypothetical protein